MALTKKQEAFALAYLKSGNATASYREVYEAHHWTEAALGVEAHRLLKNPKVALRLSELVTPSIQKNQCTADRVLQENARIALFDVRKLYNQDGSPKRPSELDDDTAAAVSCYTKNGAVPYDKNKALDMRMKHLGLYEKDNLQRAPNLQMQINLLGAE